MQINKNETKFVKIWWPTRMLIQTGDNQFEYRLVKFGEMVVVCPRKSMGSSESLNIRSEKFFKQTWETRVRLTFETNPSLSVVSSDQIEEFVSMALASKAYRKETVPEEYVALSFVSLIH